MQIRVQRITFLFNQLLLTHSQISLEQCKLEIVRVRSGMEIANTAEICRAEYREWASQRNEF
jgi:hypothetical protein